MQALDLFPALSAIAIALVVPQLTGALLAARFLRGIPIGGDDRARALMPYRRAAFLTGLGQIQLAWMAGVNALGPALVEAPGGPRSVLFGGVCAAIAFVSGGLARRVEEPAELRSTALGVVRLRLRMVPWFAGPVVFGVAAASLPLVRRGENGWAIVEWPWVLVAAAICVFGVAYGSVISGVITGSLRRAGTSLRALARDVAAREGVPLWLVLRLPTPGTRFANAAAVPWARTMIVTGETERLLSEDQLRAVLAHEAGHLSEPKIVAVARVGAASLVLFAVTCGTTIATALDPIAGAAAIVASLLVVIGALVLTRPIARRMEERADARAAETAGPIPLAEALRRLHVNAQMPLVTGARRVHPDLWDRLRALGIDPGPRPSPPPRGGRRLGLAMLVALVGLPVALHFGTDVTAADVTTATRDAAESRLRIDPWDGEAMLALAWADRRSEQLGLAEERARVAARMGVAPVPYYELWAELLAARGDCDSARDAFDRALDQRARDLFGGHGADIRLELGGYRLPPTFVARCDVTSR